MNDKKLNSASVLSSTMKSIDDVTEAEAILKDYQAGRILTSPAEIVDAGKRFADSMIEAFAIKDDPIPCALSEIRFKEKPDISLIVFDFRTVSGNKTTMRNYSRQYGVLTDQRYYEALIFDKRAPLDTGYCDTTYNFSNSRSAKFSFGNSFGNMKMDSFRHLFYFRYGYPTFADGRIVPSTHGIDADDEEDRYCENSAVVVTREAADKLASDPAYGLVAFDFMSRPISVMHPMIQGSQSYTILYEKDGKQERISLDGTHLRSVIDPVDKYEEEFDDPNTASCRIMLPLAMLRMHKSRSYVAITEANEIAVSSNGDGKFWASADSARKELEKYPSELKAFNSITRKIGDESLGVTAFCVYTKGRSGFVVDGIKNEKTIGISIRSSDELQWAREKVADAMSIDKDKYIAIGNPTRSSLEYIRKDIFAKTTLEVGNLCYTGHNYTQVMLGKSKCLYKTIDQVEIDQIVEAYRSVLSDEDFGAIYALYLLKR